MGEVKNSPKLRFDEFENKWAVTQFGKLLIDSRLGGNYENSESITDRPLIKMGNLGRGNIVLNKIQYITENEKTDEKFLIQEGDLFFNTRNTLDLVGKVAIWRNDLPKAYYNSNLMWIKFENNHFMNYRLNSFEGVKGLRRLATGTTSVAAIYTKDLLKLKLTVPTENSEQEKIANFLTAVDSKITTLTKKKNLLEQYKKGVMQQLFSHPSNTSGNGLRFKKADGSDYPEWERKRLGEVLDYEQPTKYLVSSTEYDDSYNVPVLTAGKTFVLGFTDETNDIFKDDLPVILFDDFTTATQFVNFPFKAKSSAMKILKAKGVENIKFIYEVMQTIRFEVGGHGRHWISKYSTMNIKFPCQEEQTKIANFLTAIDQKIEATSTQIESTISFKKGLLQQMFI